MQIHSNRATELKAHWRRCLGNLFSATCQECTPPLWRSELPLDAFHVTGVMEEGERLRRYERARGTCPRSALAASPRARRRKSCIISTQRNTKNTQPFASKGQRAAQRHWDRIPPNPQDCERFPEGGCSGGKVEMRRREGGSSEHGSDEHVFDPCCARRRPRTGIIIESSPFPSPNAFFSPPARISNPATCT